MRTTKSILSQGVIFLCLSFAYSVSSAAETTEENTVYSTDYIKLEDAAGKLNKLQYYAGILAIGDANGDGNDDVLSGALTHQFKFPKEILKNKPFLLIYDEKAQTFVVDQKFKDVAPEMMWPRRASISDLDGDGDNDIFVAGHGTDGGFVNCGEKNIFVERTVDGFENSSNKIANISDFSHGLSTINFDQDKAQELIIFNSPYVSKDGCAKGPIYLNQSYALDYVDNAFKRSKIISDPTDINTTEGSNTTINSSIAGDLNGDGYPDLAVGTDFEVKVLYGKEKLKFNRVATINSPEEYQSKIDAGSCKKGRSKCVTPYSDFILTDFDRDGDKDIVASLLNQKKYLQWVGSYLQAIRNDGDKWTDVTSELFGNQNHNQNDDGRWCFSLDQADIDLDGYNDIICSHHRGYLSLFTGTILLYRDGQFVSLETLVNSNEKFRNSFQQSTLYKFLLKGPENIRHIKLNNEPYLIGVSTNSISGSFASMRLHWVKITKLGI